MIKLSTYPLFLIIFTTCFVPIDGQSQDVIIRKDGRIVHADVYEVDLDVIKYKKADFSDGPLYTMLRSEVYAIAYENHSNDYFDTPQNAPLAPTDSEQEDTTSTSTPEPEAATPLSALIDTEEVYFSAGVGILTNYSKARDGISDLSKQSAFPPVNIRLLTQYNEELQIGIQLGFGVMNFNSGEYNNYDEVIFSNEIKESVFSLIVMGKYAMDFKGLQPYALGGIGFNNSVIHTDRTLRFSEDESIFNIESTARVFNMALMLRVGVDVFLTDNFGLYADIGTGISLLQTGINFKLKQ